MQSTEHKLTRVSLIFPEILAGATHDCPASIRTLNGPFLGPVHVGVRFNAQVHHHSDGPGLLGAAISKAVSWTSTSLRSLPNKAVDVIACKLSGDRLLSASSTQWLPGLGSRLSSLAVYAAVCCTIALEEA